MQFCPSQSLVISLNIAAVLAFFIASGRVFQSRAYLNASELLANVLVFPFGNCNRFSVRYSYVTSFLSNKVHMNDGFSCERHLKI